MKKTYKEPPKNYPVCGVDNCPMSDSCLHRLAYVKLIDTEQFLRLINPKQCDANINCKHYRNSTPVLFAQGFTNFQQKMFPAQYDKFMHLLITHFGRTAYYERRRGDYPLPPEEQSIIREALKMAGVKEELHFDSYEENINWYE